MGNTVISKLASGTVLPKMYEVRQNIKTESLDGAEIEDTVKRGFARNDISQRIHPGMRIAVTCGSRGVANIVVILRTIVHELKKRGAQPFVFPAMGSHGGATAEGQRDILASYRVTEEIIGCPVHSSMEVKQIGTSDDGTPIYIDKMAAESDGIIVVGRIKPHTAFRGKYESGLMKMMVIGMGKQKGAEICHLDGFGKMAERIESFGQVILKNAPVICGVGTVENAKEQTWRIAVLNPQEIIEKEPVYLEKARSLMPRIPFPEVDVLIVDQIGKDISGDGMDPNITGTFCSPYARGGIHAEHVAVLDLTDASHGCAIGVGMADFITRRLFDKINLEATYPNAITSKMVVQAKIPMILENDREAIQIALKTCCGIERRNPRIVRVHDTLHLETMWISEALMESAAHTDNIQVINGPFAFPFDYEGNLMQ